MAVHFYKMAIAASPSFHQLENRIKKPSSPPNEFDTAFAAYSNGLAWQLLTMADTNPDYKKALPIMLVGCQVGGVRHAGLDTLATAYATQNVEEAIKWEVLAGALWSLSEQKKPREVSDDFKYRIGELGVLNKGFGDRGADPESIRYLAGSEYERNRPERRINVGDLE